MWNNESDCIYTFNTHLHTYDKRYLTKKYIMIINAMLTNENRITWSIHHICWSYKNKGNGFTYKKLISLFMEITPSQTILSNYHINNIVFLPFLYHIIKYPQPCLNVKTDNKTLWMSFLLLDKSCQNSNDHKKLFQEF